MSMFGESGFDSTAKENNVANVIPKADYPAAIVNSEKIETKDGTGSYLKLTWQILSGEHQNKKIFENVNLWLKENTENRKTAVGIAKSHLSRICRAVNVLNPKDSKELHNKPCVISVGVKEAKGEYPASNYISNVKPRTSVGVPSVPVPSAPAGQPAMAGSASDSPFA